MPDDDPTLDPTGTDPAESDAGEPGGAGDAGGAGGAARSGGPGRAGAMRTVAATVLVIALVAAVAVAVLQARRAGDLEADLAERDDVAAAAGAFGEAYLSYDFDDPDGNGERVLSLATPDFAEDFSTTRAPGIEELFANLETTTRAETTEVFVGDITGDTARALVAVDVEATSAASGTQQLTDLTFVVDMVHLDGEWLVDRVNPAPQPDLSGDGVEQPAATTTTTTTTTTAP